MEYIHNGIKYKSVKVDWFKFLSTPLHDRRVYYPLKGKCYILHTLCTTKFKDIYATIVDPDTFDVLQVPADSIELIVRE